MFESTIASATASLFGGAGRSLFFDDSGAAAEDNTSPTSTTNSNTGGDDTAVDGDSNPPNPVDGNDEATNGNTKAPEGVGGSNADDARVHELEQELDEIRRAFEEYVATTQGLESGMDDEMKHLKRKLEATIQNNATLKVQMKKMDTVMEKMEMSLEGTKKRLNEEKRMRREAETRCEEMKAAERRRQQKAENRPPPANHHRPSTSTLLPAGRFSQTIEEELKKVDTDITEMVSNRQIGSQCQQPEGPVVSREAYLRVTNELETVRNELVVARRTLSERGPESAIHDSDKLKQSNMELDEQIKRNQVLADQMARYESMLDESREENTRLTEEVACLREVLPFTDRVDSSMANIDRTRTEIHAKIEREVRTKVLHEANMVREREVNALREQFKRVFKENTTLREKVEKLQAGTASDSLGIEESRLKREIERLKNKLQDAHEQHRIAISETEEMWKTKLEEMKTGQCIPDDVLQEMEAEMRSTAEDAASKVAFVKEENVALVKRVEDLENELRLRDLKISNSTKRWHEYEANQKASRDEILRLQKSNAHLSSELEYMTKIMSRMDAECERLTTEHASIKAEFDVMSESSGKTASAYVPNNVFKLKEEINVLRTKFEKLRADYVGLLDELEVSRQKHLAIQEEAERKHDNKIQFLTQKMVEREETIELVQMEKMSLVEKLRAATERFDIEVVELAVNKQKAQSSKVIENLESQLFEERERVKSLRSALKDSQDALTALKIMPMQLDSCAEGDDEKSVQSLGNGTDSSNLQSFDSSSGNPTVKMSNTLSLIDDDTRSISDSIKEGSLGEERSRSSEEQTKEELRLCKTRLESAMNDVYALKDALEKMTTAFEELKLDHDMLVELNVGPTEASELSKELHEVNEEKHAIQKKNRDMAGEILNLRLQLRNKEKEAGSLQKSLMRKEIDLEALKDEKEALVITVEKSNDEKHALLEELTRSRERVIEICSEAEKDGRAIAEAEAQEEMEILKEQRKDLQQRLEIVEADRLSLCERLEATEATLKTTISMNHFEGKSRDDVKVLADVLDEGGEFVKELFGSDLNCIAGEGEDEDSEDHIEAMKKEISSLIEDKADLLKRVDEALNSSSSNLYDGVDCALSDPKSFSGLSTSDEDIRKTIEILKKIDTTLSPLDSDNNHCEIRARLGHHTIHSSATQQAEVIRRKVSFVTNALRQSRKEHSDVLLELTSANHTIASLFTKLEEQQKLEAAIKSDKETIAGLERQLQVSDEECREFEASASRYKMEVETLSQRLQEVESEKAELEREIVELKKQVSDSIRNARRKRNGESSTKSSNNETRRSTLFTEETEELLTMAHRFLQENIELQKRLYESEETLVAARDHQVQRDDRESVDDVRTSDKEGMSSLSSTLTTQQDKHGLIVVEKVDGNSRDEDDEHEAEDVAVAMKRLSVMQDNFLLNTITETETRMEYDHQERE